MIYFLPVLLAFYTIFIYLMCRDVLNQAFIFTAVFFVASANLMSNVLTVGVSLHFETVAYIFLGCVFFSLGAFLVGGKSLKVVKMTLLHLNKRNQFNTNSVFLTVILIFNLLSIAYILREVYTLTRIYGSYSGSLLGSLSVFAEVQKFQNIGLRVGYISTFLTAFLEAEAYVSGYILVKNFVEKQKNKILFFLCFISSFLSTFCQGSRGGVFILISLVFIYIMLYRKQRNTKRISFKIIGKIIITIFIAFMAFMLAGIIAGKMWDVSWYEYLSAYLGFPIYNLDGAIMNGIPRSKISGSASFGGLYSNILPRLGIDYQSYTAYTGSSGFNRLNGHNMGNVYTIFKALNADYGYVGSLIALFIIGMLLQLLYNKALKDNKQISMMQILYAYFLSCTAFSFFSNMICGNISIFHLFEFAFGYVWVFLLTKKQNVQQSEE